MTSQMLKCFNVNMYHRSYNKYMYMKKDCYLLGMDGK